MWDSEHGCVAEGTTGRAHHRGEPLTPEQIRELPDKAQVVVTWDGGNGPHPYRVLVDHTGERRVETSGAEELLPFDGTGTCHLQATPLNRVTLGWDLETRALVRGRRPSPGDRTLWRRLRAS